MSNEAKRFDPAKYQAALQRLADHLIALDPQGEMDLSMEHDMLSLIVSGTLNGETLRDRFPAFHRKLLEHPELRQAFLDALESIEAERTGQQVPLPEMPRRRLPFLEKQASAADVELGVGGNWRTVLQRSLEQLQAIFTPRDLIYRADPDLVDDPWFTLLREEVNTAGNSISVALECTPSGDIDPAVTAFLTLAVTVASQSQPLRFPLKASLVWGDYQSSISIPEEGRVHFPDIPLTLLLEASPMRLRSGVRLVLESVPS